MKAAFWVVFAGLCEAAFERFYLIRLILQNYILILMHSIEEMKRSRDDHTDRNADKNSLGRELIKIGTKYNMKIKPCA